MVASRLINNKTRKEFIQDTRNEYKRIVDNYTIEKIEFIPLLTAKNNALKIDWEDYNPPKPARMGVCTYIDYPLEEIRSYIDWTFFFFAWNISGRYPSILQDPVKGKEAQKLFEDANKLLDQIVKESSLSAKGVVGMFHDR